MTTSLISLLSWSHLLSMLAISSAFHPPCHRLPPLTTNQLRQRQLQSSQSKLHQYSPAAAATIDISENAPRDIDSLSAWATNYGIQISDCFELTYSNEEVGDVHAITNRDLPADNPIVLVPAELIMTGGKSRQEIGTEATRAEQTLMLSDHNSFYLFLKVLKEYELGEQSTWYYYLNSLPRYYSNGASMTDFCFGCLPPYAATQAQEEKNRLKRFELALNEVTTFLSDETKRNSDLVKWAFNVVHTRYQETTGGDYALIPMADMFNHGGADYVDAYISYDDEGNCYAYSTRDVPAGRPLKVCYGDPTNPSKLLARYGFLDESSSATFCKWMAEEPSSELYQLGYPNQMLFYNDGSISNEVWDCLLYEELGNQSPAEQQQFHQACMVGDEATKAGYHDQYFPQTLSALREHVAFILNELEELATWQQSVQDKERHADLDATRHPRLPLIKRHNEFVKYSFQLVQQNLDAMVSS